MLDFISSFLQFYNNEIYLRKDFTALRMTKTVMMRRRTKMMANHTWMGFFPYSSGCHQTLSHSQICLFFIITLLIIAIIIYFFFVSFLFSFVRSFLCLALFRFFLSFSSFLLFFLLFLFFFSY